MSAQPAEASAPIGTDPYHGRLLDSDGHIYIHPDTADALFGEHNHGAPLEFLRGYVHSDEYKTNRAQNQDINRVWDIKGMGALGGFDPLERRTALDAMGVRSQLVFGGVSGGWELRADSDAARLTCARFNDYALEFARRCDQRARVCCHINMSRVDWAIAELERVIKAGAKAITLPCNEPPASGSPSHEQWDPFWARIQEADVVATIHLGVSGGLLSNREREDMMLPNPLWGESASLRAKPAFRAGGEEAISPYFMLVAHMAPELYLQTLVMGKVFERFPRLRFGIIEFGASWLGPCVERMDLWSKFMNRIGTKYNLKPSEYVRRNVRVTPFWHEDLPLMVERYGLKEAYVFSTDYPHLEGSRDPIGKFRAQLAKMDPAYAQAFFLDNPRLLFPDA
ncbi:MAG: amidohydrolase family protein [Gammaproteobacteria bacterium]